MNVTETSVERRKTFLQEFHPERLDRIVELATKAADGTAEGFVEHCLTANAIFCKLDQEVFYHYLWQYVSIHY